MGPLALPLRRGPVAGPAKRPATSRFRKRICLVGSRSPWTEEMVL